MRARAGCLPSDLATGSTPEIAIHGVEKENRFPLLSLGGMARRNVAFSMVAMTRAKDQLHLMVPQRFFTYGQHSTGDRHVYAQRTRFISSQMLAHFDNRSWPSPLSAGDARTLDPVDVRANMRRMWG
jgi:ATP-dependent DNA helicase UvrD/PcrA